MLGLGVRVECQGYVSGLDEELDVEFDVRDYLSDDFSF